MKAHILGTSALLLAVATACAKWQQLTPAANPGIRAGAGMACDLISGNVIMFVC